MTDRINETGPPPDPRALERLSRERAIVEPFTGRFGWRTLCNVVWPLVGWVMIAVAVRTGRLTIWLGVPLAAVMLQAFYMPVHECVHRTISAGRPRWRVLDRAVGSFGAWMLANSFVEHRHTHLLHHTHANDVGDPDVLNAKGSPMEILARIIAGAVLYPILPVIGIIPGGTRVLPPALRERLGAAASFRSPAARRGALMVGWSHLIVLVTASLTGFAVEAWLLFYLAGWMARLWLSLMFGWLPHHPHAEVGRYRDTRVFTFPLSTVLIRGHDYHLLHHLYPRVPHYHLRSLWNEIGPHLAEQGARIEGRAARQLGVTPR